MCHSDCVCVCVRVYISFIPFTGFTVNVGRATLFKLLGNMASTVPRPPFTSSGLYLLLTSEALQAVVPPLLPQLCVPRFRGSNEGFIANLFHSRVE